MGQFLSGNVFLSEKPFFKFPNKAYCAQVDVFKPRVYFDLSFKFVLEKEMFYFGFDIFGILSFDIKYTIKEDHAGFNIGFDTFFHHSHFQIYDTRHWNYDNDCWHVYPEDDK